MGALAGKRIAVGAADSGNYKVATGLLATYGVNQTPASTNILFEDVWLDAAPVNIGGNNNAAQVTLRRSLVTDAFSTAGFGHGPLGIYYSGARDGVLRIEESILMRNGFSSGDPKTMPWPPTGAQAWDMFSRNLYLNGQTNSMQSGMFDSVSTMMGASGDQFRPGMRVERNFFYQGYVGVGAHGGFADSAGPTGAIIDNVLQRFVGTGTNNNVGQPGWGFILGGGANAVQVTGNIVTGAQYAGTSFALQFLPIWQDCNVPFSYATRSSVVQNNVFDAGSAGAAINVTDGTTDACYGWTFPGVHGNTVSNNVLVDSKLRESEYTPVGGAIGTTNDTVFQGNKLYTDRASAAAVLGWTGADRTLKTYMAANGVAVTSTDGFPEYFSQASQQRRGQWQAKWTSHELVNYFRTGFGKAAMQ